jgi:hypothetical protein
LLVRLVIAITSIALVATIAPSISEAHLVKKAKNKTLSERLNTQEENLSHSKYVAKRGAGANRIWHSAAVRWVGREYRESLAKRVTTTLEYWINKQIAAATHLAKNSSLDPWPNCSDPYWNGGTWQDTVNCENSGNWLDTNYYDFYRCGLQFHPMWEKVYGRLCPGH